MTEGTQNTGASAPVHAFVHTPGPWGVEQTTVSNWIGRMRADGSKIEYIVAHTDRDSLRDEVLVRNDANARLIAAAPDLLEACKAALAAIRVACQDGSIIWLDPPFVLPGVHESAAERLQNVIEQAESVV